MRYFLPLSDSLPVVDFLPATKFTTRKQRKFACILREASGRDPNPDERITKALVIVKVATYWISQPNRRV
jgi:hypothetical protein